MNKILFVLIFGIVLIAGCIQQPVSTFDFSIKYTQEYAWKGYNQTITVSTTSDFESKMLDYETGNVRNIVSGKLPDSELKGFSNFVVGENNFFSLPGDLTVNDCFDASNEYIEIESGGKSHKTGGYCIENNSFRKIVQKLYDYHRQFMK